MIYPKKNLTYFFALCLIEKSLTLQQQKKYFAGGIDKIEMIKKQAFYRGTFDFSSINGSIKLKIIKKIIIINNNLYYQFESDHCTKSDFPFFPTLSNSLNKPL